MEINPFYSNRDIAIRQAENCQYALAAETFKTALADGYRSYRRQVSPEELAEVHLMRASALNNLSNTAKLRLDFNAASKYTLGACSDASDAKQLMPDSPRASLLYASAWMNHIGTFCSRNDLEESIAHGGSKLNRLLNFLPKIEEKIIAALQKAQEATDFNDQQIKAVNQSIEFMTSIRNNGGYATTLLKSLSEIQKFNRFCSEHIAVVFGNYDKALEAFNGNPQEMINYLNQEFQKDNN
jgi:hypothetical protein